MMARNAWWTAVVSNCDDVRDANSHAAKNARVVAATIAR